MAVRAFQHMEQLIELAKRGESPQGPLPGFIIIGGMKCGTTTLFAYLDRHPKICMSTPKEPDFFSNPETYPFGEPLYRSLFKEASDGQMTGEASTSYTKSQHIEGVPARMKAMVPDVKLIYLVRDPVDRAYSQWRYDVRKEKRPRTFEQTLEDEPWILETGKYIRMIEKYLDHFDRDRLRVVLFEDFTKRTKDVLDDLQDFLGLEKVDLTDDGKIHANQSPERFVRHQLIGRIRRRFPILYKIGDKLPRGFRQWAYGTLKASWLGKRAEKKREAALQPLSDETRTRLIEYYAEANQELERFLGRELAWKRPTSLAGS